MNRNLASMGQNARKCAVLDVLLSFVVCLCRNVMIKTLPYQLAVITLGFSFCYNLRRNQKFVDAMLTIFHIKSN